MKKINIDIIYDSSLIDDYIMVGRLIQSINSVTSDMELCLRAFQEFNDFLNAEFMNNTDDEYDTEIIAFVLSTHLEQDSDEEWGVNPFIYSNFNCFFCLKTKEDYTYFELLKAIAPIPKCGVFRYDSDDSLKINIFLHLMSLNAIDKVPATVLNRVVLYKGIEIGNLSRTQYIESNSLLADGFGISGMQGLGEDALCKGIFDNAALFSELTYSIFEENEDFENCIRDFYLDSASVERNRLSQLCERARKERLEICDSLALNNKIGALEEKIEIAVSKASETATEKEVDKVDVLFQKILAFAETFECPVEWLHHAYSNYVVFLANNGRHADAYPFSQKLIGLMAEDLDFGEYQRYHCYYVAGCIADALSKDEEAHCLFRKYLAFAEHDFENERQTIYETYNIMASGFIRNGNFRSAHEYSQKAIDIITRQPVCSMEDKVRLSTCYSVYAHSLMGLGENHEAVKYYSKAIELQFETTDEDSIELATAYNNLGCAHDNLNNFKEALKCYLESARIVTKVAGSMHRGLYTIYQNIATCYLNLGEDSKVVEYFRKSVEILCYHEDMDI